jgi:hypothetical protein
MNPRMMHVHIGRLVLDAPLAPRQHDTLADALSAALTSSIRHGPVQGPGFDPRRATVASLAGTIAAGITERIGAMSVDAGNGRSGEHDGTF